MAGCVACGEGCNHARERPHTYTRSSFTNRSAYTQTGLSQGGKHLSTPLPLAISDLPAGPSPRDIYPTGKASWATVWNTSKRSSFSDPLQEKIFSVGRTWARIQDLKISRKDKTKKKKKKKKTVNEGEAWDWPLSRWKNKAKETGTTRDLQQKPQAVKYPV